MQSYTLFMIYYPFGMPVHCAGILLLPGLGRICSVDTRELRYDAFSRNIKTAFSFAYRKMDVEEGRSHTMENLRQMIAWMPKVRF